MILYYNNSVFINCPFDDRYKRIFYATVFTVYKCGFVPRSSLEQDNALDNRLPGIENIIGNCKYGIHDLSRTESNYIGLPRFNMPFEMGIFFGAKKFGDEIQQSKVALILEKEKYLSQQSISDINGADTKAHYDDVNKVIKIVRDWLKANSEGKVIDGHIKIINDYKNFNENILPDYVKNLGLDINDLTYIDYCEIVELFIDPANKR